MDVSPMLVRICGALAVLKLFTLMFQSLVFLRTDLHAVLATALGTRNLRQVNRLRLVQGFRIASAADRAQLRAAHPRDLAVSRWYTLFYVLGVLWAVWFFKTWFYPSTFVVITWMGATLRNAPLGSEYWWQTAVIAALLSTNIVWPLAVFTREHRERARGAR
jgi:putative peptide zinc metalloprotease protein